MAGADGQAATPNLSQPARAWADAGAAHQERILQAGEDTPLTYRLRKVDAHGDSTRVVLETRDGTVARIVEHHGRPLPPEEMQDADSLRE